MAAPREEREEKVVFDNAYKQLEALQELKDYLDPLENIRKLAKLPPSEEPTPALKLGLEEMKKVIPANYLEKTNDHVLSRFLRARKFDVAKAVNMFTNCMKWRDDYHIDNVLLHPPLRLLRYMATMFPENSHKFTKDKWPIYLMKIGKINTEQSSKRLTVETFLRAHSFIMELQCAYTAMMSVQQGKVIDKMTTIVDLEGLNFGHYKYLKFFNALSVINEAMYPEVLGLTFVVNAPAIFPTFWNIVKPWLDEYTVSKIQFLGKDFKEQLAKYVSPDSLPIEYGGECNCPGGCVVSLLEFDFIKYDQLIATDIPKNIGKLEQVVIPVGRTHVVDIEITTKILEEAPQRRTGIEYFFTTVNKDIRFGVMWFPKRIKGGNAEEKQDNGAAATSDASPEKPKPIIRVAIQNHPSNEIPIHNEAFAYEPGLFQLVWDNGNSWTSSKQLTYGVRVLL